MPRYGVCMSTDSRAGRPRVSSRETLAEAASELFLEQGYEATSVAEIAQRAGVSRSSFFNYFSSKSDVVWSGLDERIDACERALAEGADVDTAVSAITADFVPDALALAFAYSGVMHLDGELAREGAVRAARISRAVTNRLLVEGMDELTAEVRGAAIGGAVLGALRLWAHSGPGAVSLSSFSARAMAILAKGW